MMNMDTAGDIMASGIHLVLLISAVAIIPSLLVGLCVSIFQATTQINEQTLSFIPKILAVAATGVIAGPWMLNLMLDYIRTLFSNLPYIIG